MMNSPRHGLRTVLHPTAAPVALVLLLCAAPAGAGWLSRGTGVAGAGHSLKETLEENTGIVGKMIGAVIEGDGETVSELAGEIAKTPGKLIRRAFPVLEAPHAVAEKLKSAKRRIDRFAGGVGERLAGAGATLAADARAALALDRGGRDGGWSDAALLEGEPLPAPVDSKFTAPRYGSPAEVLAALRGEVTRKPGEAGRQPSTSSWDFEQWVVSEQEARPHCYGIVDPETLPADCFGPANIEEPAAPPGRNRVEDSQQAEGFDWASGEWTAEGTGWAGWDRSDVRYSDEDREAAQVGVFAARCWGVHGVSRHGSGLYGLMQERMQRNDCPNEEANRTLTGDAGDEYATALAGVLDEESEAPAGDDYLAALNTLEAKEAERRRLEEEERERQARLEEERERQAWLEKEERRERAERRRREERHQLAEQRRLDALERRQQAEYRRQVLQNVNESLRGFAEQMNRTYGGGGSSGGGTRTCAFDYNKRPGQQGSNTCYDPRGGSIPYRQ